MTNVNVTQYIVKTFNIIHKISMFIKYTVDKLKEVSADNYLSTVPHSQLNISKELSKVKNDITSLFYELVEATKGIGSEVYKTIIDRYFADLLNVVGKVKIVYEYPKERPVLSEPTSIYSIEDSNIIIILLPIHGVIDSEYLDEIYDIHLEAILRHLTIIMFKILPENIVLKLCPESDTTLCTEEIVKNIKGKLKNDKDFFSRFQTYTDLLILIDIVHALYRLITDFALHVGVDKNVYVVFGLFLIDTFFLSVELMHSVLTNTYYLRLLAQKYNINLSTLIV